MYMMCVQSNMAYFIRYAHFQGNNPPWPADFGSTPCNVSSWNVDSSIPNTIISSCTTLLINTLSNYTCVIAQLNDVFLLIYRISDWYMESTSKTPTAWLLRPVQRPVSTEIVHPYPSRGLRNHGWSLMQPFHPCRPADIDDVGWREIPASLVEEIE